MLITLIDIFLVFIFLPCFRFHGSEILMGWKICFCDNKLRSFCFNKSAQSLNFFDQNLLPIFYYDICLAKGRIFLKINQYTNDAIADKQGYCVGGARIIEPPTSRPFSVVHLAALPTAP